MGATAEKRSRIRRRLAPTLAVCSLPALLQAGLVPASAASWVSDGLQFLLAAAAALACLRAAAREQALGRSFFFLLGLGLALWALAQALLTLGPLAPPSRLLAASRDLLFVASTAPLIAACVTKPDRPRPGALGLAADVALVSVLALFVYTYFPVAYGWTGVDDADPQLAPLFFNPQRLLSLAALWWLLHGSSGAWRRLYEELALALVLFFGVGLLSNLAVRDGSYRPGLYDLPWVLPFLWIALAAREWQPQGGRADSALEPDSVGWQAPVWKEARRGNVIALGAVALVPAVHQLATLLGTPSPAVAALRSQLTFGGTLLVGSLYLARQLHTLWRAEAEQLAREQRFRALVENSADAIGTLDREGRFAYLSASSERVTGHRPDELLGHSPLELVHPAERERMERELADVSRRPGTRAGGVVRYRHGDGTFHHGAIDALNLADNPALGAVVLHLRDVTEQRLAEEARARSLSLLEAALESTADGIAVLGGDGSARFNRRMLALWRFPDDIIGTRDREAARRLVLDQLRRPRVLLERVRELTAHPERASFDTLELRDGRVFECYSLPQRLAGEVTGRVWSFRDVTERVRAEQAMARLVAIIEATPDFVLTCDATLRPLYVNRAGRRMVGLADEEPLGERHTAEFHPPGAAARLLEQAVPTALREGVWSGETLLRRRDGHEIPVLQVVLAHRSPTGEVDFLSTIARDISQRIRAEEELRRSHTMVALGALVAGVAHEVRNPLFGISSTLDAFEARFASEPQQRQYVEVLRGELERLSGLMNDLLEYAKPQRLELVPGRLDDVVAQALAACAPLAERAQVRVESALDPDLPALRFDPLRLGQVFRNLLENAVQHSPRGGRVFFAARLSASAGGAAVECSVEDEGPGFAPSDLARVFEPFFSRRTGGTGLGLSIVQHIVSEHGGTITARNRPAGGARLTVSLPTGTPAEEQAP